MEIFDDRKNYMKKLIVKTQFLMDKGYLTSSTPYKLPGVTSKKADNKVVNKMIKRGWHEGVATEIKI